MKPVSKLTVAAILTVALLAGPLCFNNCGLSAHSQDNQIVNTKRKIPPHGIPADVTSAVERVSTRVAKWYPLLGSKLGVHLTNPNIVLLLADERGLADLNFYDWSKEDIKRIEDFNNEAMKDGVRISYDPKAKLGGEADGFFESLRGFERVSKTTKLKGIPPFEASEGWEGLTKWKNSAVEQLNKCAKEGIYKEEIDKSINPGPDPYFPTAQNNSTTTAILRGLAYAYPDTAIYLPDAAGDTWTFTVIPYGDFHRASEPNFSYSTRSDMRAVNKLVARWGTILGEFYHSDEYEKLAAQKEFLTARTIADGFGQNAN